MSDDRAVARTFGFLLLAVGALFVLLCGSCTVFFVGAGVVGVITDPHTASTDLGGLFMELLIGGVPTAGGVVCVVYGWRLLTKP